jgi:hypothetical protein
MAAVRVVLRLAPMVGRCCAGSAGIGAATLASRTAGSQCGSAAGCTPPGDGAPSALAGAGLGPIVVWVRREAACRNTGYTMLSAGLARPTGTSADA